MKGRGKEEAEQVGSRSGGRHGAESQTTNSRRPLGVV